MSETNPYILGEPVFQTPGYFLEFFWEEGDNNVEVEMMNDYSRLIQKYVRNPFLFMVDNERGDIGITYKHLVQSYKYVLQCLLGRTQTDDTRYLIVHYDFLFNQYGAILERKGVDSVVVSTERVLQDLYYFFKNGDRFGFHYILGTPQEVLDLYSAFKQLYFGDPKAYLDLIPKYL
ncbi:hypothetical protein SAMN04487995_5923 [Dyadobacter koreensis]|uniref:Uncharacterized protein n=1 Tax=Dyadobacter koreensis TaxID=408657 RepID=A0A1H7B5S3_9BACT|nr:hypothetical protein [Dyadobacter koreensis]SEJ68755.1 hypothetical protein SAMN04487995_5923 [Dyadobacter koreensis]